MKNFTLLFMMLCASFMWSQTYIDEDFSSATGTTPPAGWTNNDINASGEVWMFDNPGGWDIISPMTDPVAIFDSDYGGWDSGAEDAALESPVFDATSATDVVLMFDHFFYDSEWDYGGVYNVEVFNGTAWVSVLTGGTDTANPASESIDITAHVAGVSNAQVRFHWTGDYAFYWIIDNIYVGAPPTCPNPSGIQISNIADNSADVTWSSNGTETAWEIVVQLDGAGEPVNPGNTVSTMNYNASGLNESTDYEVYLRADCGAGDFSSWVGPIAFRTTGPGNTCEDAIEITSLPYTTSDDTSFYENDYVNGDSPCSSYYMSGDDVVYSFTPSSDMTLDISLSDISDSYAGIHILDACIGSSPNCIAFAGDYTTNDRELEVDVVANTTYYIFISTWAAPDNVSYTLNISEQTCITPENLVTSNVSPFGVDISWDAESGAVSGYEWVVVLSGGDPSESADVITSGTTTDIFDTVSGLSQDTAYEVYVRSDCDTNGLSNFSAAAEFITPCEAFVPEYMEDFASFLPSCWMTAGNGLPSEGPSEVGSGEWYHDSFLNIPGSNNSAKINLYWVGKQEWLISPIYDLSGGVYELEMEVGLTDYFENAPPDLNGMGSDDEIRLLITTDNGATWQTLITYDQTNYPTHTGEMENVDLSVYSGNVQFAFWGSEGIVDDDEDYEFFVNSFAVVESAVCYDPSMISFSNEAETSIEVEWTAGGDETEWEVVYGPTGFDPLTEGTTLLDDDGVPGVVVSGLTADTDYDFYIIAICGSGIESNLIGPETVSTLAAGACGQVQVSNNFENGYFIESGGQKIANDFIVSANTTNFSLEGITVNLLAQGGGVSSMDIIFYEDDGGMPGVEIETVSGVTPLSQDIIGAAFGYDIHEVVMELPSVVDFAGDGVSDVSYWMQLVAYPESTGTQVAWEITSVDPIGELYVYDNDGNGTTEWVSADATGDGVFTLSGTCTYVDCPSPEGLMVENLTMTSVDFIWDEIGTATEWEIIYGIEGFDPETEGTVVTDNDGTLGESITGLNADTVYEFYVMSFCDAGEESSLAGPFSFFTGYCESVPSNVDGNGLASAQVGTTNFTSAGSGVTYEDFTATIVELPQGLEANVELVYDHTYGYYTHVWVDFNNDLNFDSSELVFSGQSNNATPNTVDASFQIPIDAPLGTHRMRIVGTWSQQTPPNPCYNDFWGVTSDFTIDVIEAPDCLPPSNLSIVNLSASEVTLGWDAFAGATDYNYILIYEGLDPETATPLASGNTSALEAVISALDADTAYEVYIQSNCGTDGNSMWTGISFFTGYCDSEPELVDGTGLTSAEIGTTNFTSAGGDVTYENFTDTTVQLPQGLEANVELIFGHSYGYYTHVWVDYSNDLVFDDEELVFSGQSNSGSPNLVDASFQVPVDAPMGTHRMRVVSTWSQQVPPDPCYNGYWGVTSDFTIDITEAPTCLAPSNIVISDLFPDSATFTWDAFAGAVDYEYIIIYAGLDPDTATPLFAGTTTATTVTINTLDSGTDYEIFIRSNCSDTETSAWNDEAFSTPLACGDDFYDTGGLSGGYQNNENLSWTFAPDNADEFVQINFSVVNLETCCDQLTVYDGPDTSAPVLAADLQSPGIFTSSTPGGALTVTFTSDGSVTYGGWEASILCLTCIAPPNIGISNLTSSSATVSWDAMPGVVGYEYIVVYEGVDPEIGTPILTGPTTDTFVDLSGLDDATSYDVYVRTECEVGDFSPWSSAETFLTYCDPVTDFSENFDSVTTPDLPVCWDRVLDNGVSDFATVNTTAFVSFSGSNAVDMYNSNSTLTSNIMLVSPMVSNLDAGTHWFRFYARNSVASQEVEVGTMSDPTDGSTFTAVELIDINTEWDEYTVDFTTYTGTDNFIVIRRLNSSTYTNVYIDNAVWEERPTCIYPDDVVVNSTTIDGANVTWEAVTNATNGYAYVVVEQGGDPDVPGDVVVSGTSATAEVDVTGLQSGTIYEIYVMADCGATDGMSSWSAGEQFTTAYGCGDMFYDTGGPTAGYSSNENEVWTIYPDDPSEYVQINFTMVDVEGWTFDNLRVYDGPDNSYPELSTGDGVLTPGTYTSSAPGQPLTVTFTSDGVVNYSGWEAQIECVTCIAPVNIQIDELFADGATVSWDALADAIDGYEWVVVLLGGDPETEAIASGTASDNFVTIEGLESGTDYEVFLISNCGDVNGLSGFSSGVPFSTLCQAPTGLMVTATGEEDVTFSWDPIPGAVGYEFIIVESGMPLTEENYVGLGTIGSGEIDSMVVEYLEVGVDYDLYLRIVCDTGYYGEWGMTEFTTDTSGITENHIEGFKYYPNPVQNLLYLEAPQNIEAVKVYNMLGQVVVSEVSLNTSAEINLSKLQAGAYIVKVTVGTTVGTYRILKE